ncbi:hypothetical protein JXB12_13410 [candidate division KSB1 bacterium]|nr:hypothetical protein [candidate division KSB1 bacterium]
MMKKLSLFLLLNLLFVNRSLTAIQVTILKINGEVQIRKGVEETWIRAREGMILEDIDSIMTGVGSSAELSLTGHTLFRLASNAMLDVTDLRDITEQELFLYIMEQKLKKIEPASSKTKLRIGNVSVVHGESQSNGQIDPADQHPDFWIQEKNGAIALYEQDYLTNSIVKIYKTLEIYPNIQDCGEMHLYLGKSFEALHKKGQAIESYMIAMQKSQTPTCDIDIRNVVAREADLALKRLDAK